MLVFESLNITFTLILVIRPLSNSMFNVQSINQSIYIISLRMSQSFIPFKTKQLRRGFPESVSVTTCFITKICGSFDE